MYPARGLVSRMDRKVSAAGGDVGLAGEGCHGPVRQMNLLHREIGHVSNMQWHPVDLHFATPAGSLIGGGETLLVDSEGACQEAARANIAMMTDDNTPVGPGAWHAAESGSLHSAGLLNTCPPRRCVSAGGGAAR